MCRFNRNIADDRGWTLAEAVVTMVITAIMVLGLTVTVLAVKEQLNRSWAVRVMDEYANDVIENVTHDLRNAAGVRIPQINQENDPFDRVAMGFVTNWDRPYDTSWCYYAADPRGIRITKTGYLAKELIPRFVPTKMEPNERYSIQMFNVGRYGASYPALIRATGRTISNWEERERREANVLRDPNNPHQDFVNSLWDVRLVMKYTKTATVPGQKDYEVVREYFNRVYVRNLNTASAR